MGGQNLTWEISMNVRFAYLIRLIGIKDFMKKLSQNKRVKSERTLLEQAQPANEQDVSRRAYELWEASGCQHGNDVAHWLEAVNEIKARRLLNRNAPSRLT
jgi:Protein of unknown function (DUF2934)